MGANHPFLVSAGRSANRQNPYRPCGRPTFLIQVSRNLPLSHQQWRPRTATPIRHSIQGCVPLARRRHMACSWRLNMPREHPLGGARDCFEAHELSLFLMEPPKRFWRPFQARSPWRRRSSRRHGVGQRPLLRCVRDLRPEQRRMRHPAERVGPLADVQTMRPKSRFRPACADIRPNGQTGAGVRRRSAPS